MTIAVLLFAATAAQAAPESFAMPTDPDVVRTLLKETGPASLMPFLTDRARERLLASERAQEIRAWANGAGKDIPATTQALYDRFREAGERYPYEGPYFGKRERLTRFVLAAWLQPERADYTHIAALVESILAEPTWVLPAHEKPVPWNIDLFAAETACELAHALALVGDRLPPALVERTRGEIKARVMDPYLEHAHDYWWDGGRNNWTGVCAGATGQTFLLLEPDPDRLARAVALVLGQQERFLANGFEEDGACLEGIGYWCYGLLHFVCFSEMLREASDRGIDGLAHPKLESIARYPAIVALDRHVFASFADSHEHSSLTPLLAARLAERTGVESLLPQSGGPFQWRLTAVLRNVFWMPDAVEREPQIKDAFLPESGIVKIVGEADGRKVVLAAKAGHNAEPHNNNDVGSFILRIGDATFLCDPGAGLYSREYFSAKRYENIFANSYGHSVPRIGGKLQFAGSQFRGSLEKTGPKSVRIAFHEAYDVPELRRAVREFAVRDDGSVVMTVEYGFDGAGLEVEETFVTWQDVEVDGALARIRSKNGVLAIRAAAGAFAAERLEEQCKANRKSDVLTRITLTMPAASEIADTYTMTWTPDE